MHCPYFLLFTNSVGHHASCGASSKKSVAAILGAATTRAFHCSVWPFLHHNRVSATRGVHQRLRRYPSTIRHAPARLSVPLHLHRPTGPGLTQRSSGLAALAAERSPLGSNAHLEPSLCFCAPAPFGASEWCTSYFSQRHTIRSRSVGSVRSSPLQNSPCRKAPSRRQPPTPRRLGVLAIITSGASTSEFAVVLHRHAGLGNHSGVLASLGVSSAQCHRFLPVQVPA